MSNKHNLYKTGDADAPRQILDRNGEVVLDCCKKCGLAEIELGEDCNVHERDIFDWMWLAEK